MSPGAPATATGTNMKDTKSPRPKKPSEMQSTSVATNARRGSIPPRAVAVLLGSTTAPEPDQMKSWPPSWKMVLRRSIERGCPVVMPESEPEATTETEGGAPPEPAKEPVEATLSPRHAAVGSPTPPSPTNAQLKTSMSGSSVLPSSNSPLRCGGSAAFPPPSAPSFPRVAAVPPTAEPAVDKKAGGTGNAVTGVGAAGAASKEEQKSAVAGKRAATAAAALGLRVCGVDLGSLLGEQMAMEAATNRVVNAYRLMDRCASMLPPSTLALFLKIKSPPTMLARVIEASLVLLSESPPPVSPNESAQNDPASNTVSDSNTDASNGNAVNGVCPEKEKPSPPKAEVMSMRMSSIDVDAITDDQLNRLAPFLTELNYELVHKSFGVAAFLWGWVCAVCVICGSPFAVLPTEDQAAAAAVRLSPTRRIRSCNGSPITGRPSYSSNFSSDDRLDDDDSFNKRRSSEESAAATISARSSEDVPTSPSDCAAGEAASETTQQLNRHSMRKSLRRSRLTLTALTPLKFLGAGAFANVFMCQHQASGQLMALKCILKSVVLKKKKQHQVRAEKAALSCSPHPNVIRMYASFSDEQHLYFAMELALGGELFALIEEMDTLPEAAVRYYAASVILALTHLHDHGFIYRDLKPENVLLDSSGHLKVCDLGLAKQAGRAFSVVGTPQYLPPEVLRGDGATFASDWWALGVLIFEMTTGDLPFTSPDGTDKALFALIKRGLYSWPQQTPLGQPQKGPTPRKGAEPASPILRDLVGGLLRHALPEPKESATKPAAAGTTPFFEALAKKRVASPLPKTAAGPMRLGGGAGGDSELRSHTFFKQFDFEALLSGQMAPPYLPILRGTDDDSNFGPINWRGDPVLISPEYDAATWDAQWEEDAW